MPIQGLPTVNVLAEVMRTADRILAGVTARRGAGGADEEIAVRRAPQALTSYRTDGRTRVPIDDGAGKSTLVKLIRQLRDRGDVSQIVIAHNYLHVLETCDRVCLPQNGRITFDRPTAETTVEELLTLVGAEYRVPE